MIFESSSNMYFTDLTDFKHINCLQRYSKSFRFVKTKKGVRILFEYFFRIIFASLSILSRIFKASLSLAPGVGAPWSVLVHIETPKHND